MREVNHCSTFWAAISSSQYTTTVSFPDTHPTTPGMSAILSTWVKGDSAAVSAVLGTASTRGVGFEIVHGGMSATKDSAYGLLTVALTGEAAAVDAFVADLAGAGDVQEVHQ